MFFIIFKYKTVSKKNYYVRAHFLILCLFSPECVWRVQKLYFLNIFYRFIGDLEKKFDASLETMKIILAQKLLRLKKAFQ